MDDSDRLEALELFVAALVVVMGSRGVPPESPLDFDERTFARVVLATPDNPYTNKFKVLSSVTGPSCHDFQQGVFVSVFAGIIARRDRKFRILLSGRQVERLQVYDLFVSVVEAATLYLDMLYGYVSQTPSSQNSISTGE